MKFDGVIFDLDGTLWDASESALKGWRHVVSKFFPEYELPSMEDLQKCMGYNAGQIAEYYRYKYGNKSEEIIHKCMLDESGYIADHGAKIFSRLEDTLKVLQEKYKLYIVSNCQVGYIESFFHVSGFEAFFDDYVCEGGTGLSKGENIKLIAKRNNIIRPIYVGDTYIDEQAANLAECPIIFAAYGFGKIEKPYAVINTPTDLLSIL